MTEPEIEALRSRVTGLLELIVNCANPPPCRMCRQHADDLLAALEALVSQQARAKGCINCGEANDGGYMSGREGHVDEGAVGPFCSSCWELLQEDFQIVSQSQALESLAMALRKFGEHERECSAKYDPRRVGVIVRAAYPCTCGLNAALALLPEPLPVPPSGITE